MDTLGISPQTIDFLAQLAGYTGVGTLGVRALPWARIIELYGHVKQDLAQRRAEKREGITATDVANVSARGREVIGIVRDTRSAGGTGVVSRPIATVSGENPITAVEEDVVLSALRKEILDLSSRLTRFEDETRDQGLTNRVAQLEESSREKSSVDVFKRLAALEDAVVSLNSQQVLGRVTALEDAVRSTTSKFNAIEALYLDVTNRIVPQLIEINRQQAQRIKELTPQN